MNVAKGGVRGWLNVPKARQQGKKGAHKIEKFKHDAKRKAGWLGRLTEPKPWRGGMQTVEDLRRDAYRMQ